ncbi:glycoside hydrolase family 88 protein [Candidatus Binatus sp.]|uniref:glycoside hydrolase family 88 protein n=1 Tax=Candidatus Binatus sp. TaxID=2811406 RepID=UPI003CC6069D
MDSTEIRNALERLTANASRELLAKQPHWGDAILCDGLLYAARVLGSDAPVEAAQRWFEPKLAAGPRTNGWFWFWAAEALPALDMYAKTNDPRYLEYARAIAGFMETSAARTADGAYVPHPPALEVWIDVCYFTAPALALLGRMSGDSEMIERAADQMIVHRDHLIDPGSGLFWHVAYVERKSHSQCLWARGNSWFSIAAPQVLAEIEAAGGTHRLAAKVGKIRAALARQLNKIVSLQDESGLWHTVIDRDDSYLEPSSAAGFALALGRALRTRLSGLDEARARIAYTRAIDAICGKIDVHGAFTDVSQQTPPGDFAFYNSIEVGTAPFATGVCMMALSEAVETWQAKKS